MTPKNPAYEQTIREKLKDQHFMRHIGFDLTLITPGYVEGELNFETFHKQQNGFLHGGVTATVADLVMGFAAYTLADVDEGTVTSDLKVAYLRPGTGHKIIGKGRVIKAGNLLFYCEADIISVEASGEVVLIARGYSTMCAIKLPK